MTPTTDAPGARTATPAPIRIRVPQASGEIVIHTFDAAGPHRFAVKDGLVSAGDKAAAELVLARVDGAVLDPDPAK